MQFFECAEKIDPSLKKLDFEKVIEIAEAELRKFPNSDFQVVLDASFAHLAGDLADWIDQYYQAISKKMKVVSLYFEANEFTLNTDVWYIDGFAYAEDGGLDDIDWLSNWESDTQNEMGSVFQITNLETLQAPYAKYNKNAPQYVWQENDEVEEARNWCTCIIIARFMELMRKAHLVAKEKQYSWAESRIYFTGIHDFSTVVKTEN